MSQSVDSQERVYDDIWLFSYPNWSKFFTKNRIRSECIPLSHEFIQYLLQDGVHIPEHLFTITKPSNTAIIEEIVEDPTFFPDIISKIQDAIDTLGGDVFPKLNWSSPRDAAWVTHDRTIKCSYVRDILILLKSSKCVANDFTKLPLLSCDNPHPDVDKVHHLVLKKWSKLYPAREFRIFVRNKHIVAVSQRDTVLYEGLQEPKMLAHLKEVFSDFHHDYVQSAFPAHHYTYDVYVDTKDKVFMLDMHPWGVGDALLFDWTAELAPLASAVDIEPFDTDSATAPTPIATEAPLTSNEPQTTSPEPLSAPASATTTTTPPRESKVGHLTFLSLPRLPEPPTYLSELWEAHAARQRAAGATVAPMSDSLPYRCWRLALSSGLEDEEVADLLAREEAVLKTEAFELSRAGCLVALCRGVVDDNSDNAEWEVAWEASRALRQRKEDAKAAVAVSSPDEAKEDVDPCAGVLPYDPSTPARTGALVILPVDAPWTLTLPLSPPLPPCPIAEEDSTVNFPLRVVTGLTESEGQRKATVESVVNRMPVELVDVSDAAAIERFIAMQRQMGNVASWSDEDEDSDDDDDDK